MNPRRRKSRPSPSTYFIRTFGCQMNVADSLAYAGTLQSLGLSQSDSEIDADILVVNTCSVRNKAEEKAISYFGAISKKRLENQKSGGIIFVGCMATVRGDEMLSRFPDIEAIIPAKELDTFENTIVETFPDLPRTQMADDLLPLLRPEEKFERFVPIVRGCRNRCTYCIVPRARGGEIDSRHPSDIFREIGVLIETGIKSITLLGQNVCAYGTDSPPDWAGLASDYGIAHLLADIRDKFGDSGVWFKFLTSHPRDLDESLLDVVASHGSFSRHFHLPLQAGNDEVLKRMARGYTSGKYIDLIELIRKIIPDARITTDLIVGFPGEDETAFEDTLEMVRKIRFDAAFTFLYSPRSETPAEKWADPVPNEVKKQRLQELIKLQNQITLEIAVKKVGEERPVLIEGSASSKPDRSPNTLAGRTRDEEVVVVEGSEKDIGNFIRVKLISANLRSFTGVKIS
jgi:tRNA-2-methylthio-N6-dimethylallyladenosine synthase